ncbi:MULTISPECIES: Com family DNA-binding transcriptional regulator [unclassified Marinimicrobium]|uniref:Com family DNA-binding transcriptional regulator n=1 Tax=unclassified Marinimicrobium TaxID=2632100 RepID=UPI000C3D3EA7|nr:Com family DNA-binding transcriptional regulator [Marinimicrobium sp.]
MKEVRCTKCRRKLAMAAFSEIEIKCPRCGAVNHQKATSLQSHPDRRQHGHTHHPLAGR